MTIPPEVMTQIKKAQQGEMTEYYIYTALSQRVSHTHNRDILTRIAEQEKSHSEFWAQYTGTQATPNAWKVWWFTTIARLFGLTFGLRLMEKGEVHAQSMYASIIEYVPEGKSILEDEKQHEQELIELLHEKKLDYMGSVVLGLNDALVELTGALAGLSFAFQNTHLIAVTGLITGVAASFSMAASEYLSNKADGNKDAHISALYTGLAYIGTVLFLVTPFFVFTHYAVALGVSLSISILIIFFFNFYLSIARNTEFWKRFFEMAGISLGVSALSFGIGIFVRFYFGIEV